jgi:hypothetical protein
MTPDLIVRAYVEAWSVTDEVARGKILERC